MNVDPRISFGYADVGEVKLHYATAGQGKRLVLLLHGFPEFWYSWRHQLLALSDTYTVVAPDLRGYNLSDSPQDVGSYGLGNLVGDVLGLIRHFGGQNAAIIGHDWGAAIAWAFARRHPDLTWKLASLQVPPPEVWKRNITAGQLFASWYMFFFQLPWLPEWIVTRCNFAILKRALRTTAATPAFSDEDIATYKVSWRQHGGLTGPVNYYRANVLRSLFSRAILSEARITCPALFIYGEKDHAILPATVRNVGSAVSGPYHERRIPCSAHWVQQEAADEVTQVLRDFLAE